MHKFGGDLAISLLATQGKQSLSCLLARLQDTYVHFRYMKGYK